MSAVGDARKRLADDRGAQDGALWDEVSDWLGSMREARNQYDITNEATTVLTIDVEQLARRIAARERAVAEKAWNEGYRANYDDNGHEPSYGSANPYRALGASHA